MFEGHMVYASAGQKRNWVALLDRGPFIQLKTPACIEMGMTPEEARYLARKLYRLARLVEARQEARKGDK